MAKGDPPNVKVKVKAPGFQFRGVRYEPGKPIPVDAALAEKWVRSGLAEWADESDVYKQAPKIGDAEA